MRFPDYSAHLAAYNAASDRVAEQPHACAMSLLRNLRRRNFSRSIHAHAHRKTAHFDALVLRSYYPRNR